MGFFDALEKADGQRVALAQALSDLMEGGKQTARNVRGAAQDPQFWRDVGQGLQDVGNRGVAGVVGAPVDLAALPFRAVGLGHPAPVGGSEWLGQKMQDAGMVSPERRPVPEFLAAVALPGAQAKAARGISMGADAIANAGPGPLPGSMAAQLGAISPDGYKNVLAAYRSGQLNGNLRLGDVTEGQGTRLAEKGAKSNTRDVVLTEDGFNKIYRDHVLGDGFTPEEMALFTKQAMAKQSHVIRDPGKGNQHAALINYKFLDPVTKRTYDAMMPLKSDGEFLEVRSVYPDGLPARPKKKNP